MPATLVEATVRASLSFISHSSTAITLGATAPAVLAKGVLHAMMISRLRFVAAAAFAGCGMAALGAATLGHQERPLARPPEAPQAKASAEPENRDAIGFRKLALSTDDLVDATGLDVYKYRVDVAKGERFTIVLRSQESKEAPMREMIGYSFEKTSDDPAIVRVSFLRMDRKLSGFLMSNEAQAEYRLNCSNCKPGGLVTYAKNPLGTDESIQRGLLVCNADEESKQYSVDVKETLLLRVMNGKADRGVNVDGYPRGEVVVVKGK